MKSQRLNIAGLFLQEILERLSRNVTSSGLAVDHREPCRCGACGLRVSRQESQERDGLVRTLHLHVEIGEHQPSILGIRVREDLQWLLGFAGALQGHVEPREHPVRHGVIRFNRQRVLQRLFGLGHATRGPIEIRQRHSGRHRFRVGLESLLEGGLRFGALTLRQPEYPEIGLQSSVGAAELQRFFDLGNRACHVLQPGHRVRLQQERGDVPRLLRQDNIRPRFRVFVALGEKEVAARRELDVRVVRQQIGRANVLRKRALVFLHAFVCLGELPPRVSKKRILLDGIPILNHRFGITTRLEVLVTAL